MRQRDSACPREFEPPRCSTVEVADRIGLALPLGDGLDFDLGSLENSTALPAAVATIERVRWDAVDRARTGSRPAPAAWPAEATIADSSSTPRAVEAASLGCRSKVAFDPALLPLPNWFSAVIP